MYRDMCAPIASLLAPGARVEDVVRASVGHGLVRIPETPEAWIESRLAAHRNPGPAIEHEQADGRWFLVTERRTAEGGVVCVRTDVTALKEQARRLRESEATLTRSAADLAAPQQRLGEQARDHRAPADQSPRP